LYGPTLVYAVLILWFIVCPLAIFPSGLASHTAGLAMAVILVLSSAALVRLLPLEGMVQMAAVTGYATLVVACIQVSGYLSA
jgi:hypothetical protein